MATLDERVQRYLNDQAEETRKNELVEWALGNSIDQPDDEHENEDDEEARLREVKEYLQYCINNYIEVDKDVNRLHSALKDKRESRNNWRDEVEKCMKELGVDHVNLKDYTIRRKQTKVKKQPTKREINQRIEDKLKEYPKLQEEISSIINEQREEYRDSVMRKSV